MHHALVLIARAIALAHDHWRRTIGRRRLLSGKIAVLEERVQQLRAENALLRTRLLRIPAKRRPHYRRSERLEILWHAARYRLSITDTAVAFCVTRQTITSWRRALRQKEPRVLPRAGTLGDLVHELVIRLRAEWPPWGTRRIAGQLAQLGVRASRSSVQRILRRPPLPGHEDRLLPHTVPGVLAKRPNHVWMSDFTRLGGLVRPAFAGAVIDACSRRILAIAFIRGEPNSRFAAHLLQQAIGRHGAPTWLVSDRDRAFRSKRVNTMLGRYGIRRRYGAVGRKGSIAIIERMWRSLKQEYVRQLFLYRSRAAIDQRLRRWARWHNTERPHQGLEQRTPDDVYRGRPPTATRDLSGGTLPVGFLDGDRRLPVLRLRDAA
ncbi:MAG: DDE-type integrase/transposase/recombinase [Planctomycetota bacterium]|nr:DDE-type integrase/transposase/recombinase [Planctomycetota bacterium]